MINSKSAYDMLRLISSLLSNDPHVEFSFSEDEISELCSTAKAHSLSAMTADALEKAGILNDSFHEEKAKAQRNSVLLNAECEYVCRKLAENNISHMPLKGSVIKKFYPKQYYREMVDVDILIDPSCRADARKLMESLGYHTVRYGDYNDDVYQKLPIFTFELHSYLFDAKSNPELFDYYASIRNRLAYDDQSEYRLRMSPEDLYIYMILHARKHFIGGGIGLKYLLDTFLFLETNLDLSWEYINRELLLLKADDFERHHRILSKKVFTSQTLSSEEEALLKEYLLYGAHGTHKHYISHQIKNNPQKDHMISRYVIRRVFPTGNDIPYGYDFFNRYKVLLPVLWIYRPIKALLHHPKEVMKEIKAICDTK